MSRIFGQVYAPATLGQFCAEFTTVTPVSWPRLRVPICLPWRAGPICCRGSRQVAFVDIDSLLRPVYGHAKQGASFGHTKIAEQAGAAARPVAAGGARSAPDRGTGDRRDPAAGRERRLSDGLPARWFRNQDPPARLYQGHPSDDSALTPTPSHRRLRDNFPWVRPERRGLPSSHSVRRDTVLSRLTDEGHRHVDLRRRSPKPPSPRSHHRAPSDATGRAPSPRPGQAR